MTAWSRPRRPSLKTIGRKKVTFHLDQLIYFDQDAEGFSWFCEMAEAGVRVYGTGVVCGEHEIGIATQEEAEERALTHIVEMHQAMGGNRLPKDRGRIRRQKKIDEWNARHARPKLTSVKDEEHYD